MPGSSDRPSQDRGTRRECKQFRTARRRPSSGTTALQRSKERSIAYGRDGARPEPHGPGSGRSRDVGHFHVCRFSCHQILKPVDHTDTRVRERRSGSGARAAWVVAGVTATCTRVRVYNYKSCPGREKDGWRSPDGLSLTVCSRRTTERGRGGRYSRCRLEPLSHP